ncbi:TerD family protein [Bacillus sp. AFS053548]|uniref:TerD family protein n=1 Tax=Bacillus sp. AFS053548 TaxID=2033505 RepID=UPI000BFE3FEE|nr:TerD family protein [Bacillus sp. AFS053548]PGM55435.1 cytoplasmic protein [Bacillus sp. AFS053548]
MNQTNILFRRKNSLYIEKQENNLSNPLLATALKQLEAFGYTFSLELIEILQTWNDQEFIAWFIDFKEIITHELGYDVDHIPFYKNFPNDVMKIDEAKIYMNSLLYYIFNIQPLTLIQNRPSLRNKKDLKIINLAKQDDLNQIIKRLIDSTGSFKSQDIEDIQFILLTQNKPLNLLPELFLSKEKMVIVLKLLYQSKKINANEIANYLKTATDVLRFCVALSDGDPSLSMNTKFISFSRKDRKLVLSLLNEIPHAIEEMVKRRNVWIRIGEKLHPGEYSKRFPHAENLFSILRNEKQVSTYQSKITKYLSEKNLTQLTSELIKRPGEFARKLDFVLRSFTEKNDQQYIVSQFSIVCKDVSTPVLLSLWNHFNKRNDERRIRTFFPKGNIAKLYAIENKITKLSEVIIDAVLNVVKKTLSVRFSVKESLGKVWLDESYRNFTLPNGLRSASKSLRTIPRGSHIPIGEGDIIRFFLYWKEGDVNGVHTGTVDIDLSAVFYDDNFNYISDISYYELKSKRLKCYHSGDFTSAPKGASEFIDCHIPTLKNNGIRYVVLSVNSYSDHSFCNLPSCFAGWMLRDDFKSGKVFEPSTVMDRFDLANDQKISIPLIFDTFEQKVIWCDLGLQDNIEYYNNAKSNSNSLAILTEAMTEKNSISLYELLELHAIARGELVSNKNEADTVFSFNEEVTPYRYDLIVSEFMS